MPLSRITGNSFNATANTNIDNGLLFLNPTTNRVGINVTNPSYPLDIVTDAASQTVSFRGRAVDNTTRIDFFNNGANTAFGGIYSFSNELGFEASQAGGAIAFRSGGTSDRVRITSAGVLDVLTGQIKFPASQAASSNPNTLDDYEEGTWTPTLRGSAGSAGSYAQSTQSGTYIKIGKMVWIYGFLQVSNKGSYSGVVYFNLPFAAEGNFLGAGPVRSQMHSFSGTLIVEYSTADSVTARFNVTSSGGAQANLDWSQLSSAESNFLSFALVYQATA